MNILIILIASVLSGILYHLGGIGKPWNTKWRDWGVPLVLLSAYFLLTHIFVWYCYVASFLLTWLALSTYWKKDGVDAEGWNWFLHGLGIGLGMLPFLFVGMHWSVIVLRAFVLGVAMMVWSQLIDNAATEEFGRGVLIVLTLPLII